MNGHNQPLLKSYESSGIGSSRKLVRLFGRSRSLRRFLVVVFLLALTLSGWRRYSSRDGLESRYQELVLGNCASIEPLRHAEECVEAVELLSKKQRPKRHMKPHSTHLEREEDIPWISSYGLVLDYDAVYDRVPTDSTEEFHTTKRTLKCNTGFHMSIVWDLEFSTPLLDVYKSGEFGILPNTPSDVAATCPSPTAQSSASMSIKINCGIEIKRDEYGHPATEHDKAEMETCLRMAWSWVQGRIGHSNVGPWAGLCHIGQGGTYECDRDVFHLEGADT